MEFLDSLPTEDSDSRRRRVAESAAYWAEDRIDWSLLPDEIWREWQHDNPQTLAGVVDWVETRIDWPLLPDEIWREWTAFKASVKDDMNADASEKKVK